MIDIVEDSPTWPKLPSIPKFVPVKFEDVIVNDTLHDTLLQLEIAPFQTLVDPIFLSSILDEADPVSAQSHIDILCVIDDLFLESFFSMLRI